MKAEHFRYIEAVNSILKGLGQKFVYLGGASVAFHLDDDASYLRPTKDVDIITEIASYTENYRLSETLQELGFVQNLDPEEPSPICRWERGALILDVMPVDPEVLGFSTSRWFRSGFERSVQHKLPGGDVVESFDSLHFIAAKIEAFADRGCEDLMESKDVEDICTVLDGRSTIFEELARDEEVARFTRGWLMSLDADDLLDALAGHVDGYDRAEWIMGRLPGMDGAAR